MPQVYGPSNLDGYDFTRIKAFSDQYYIQLPAAPSGGDVLVFNGGTQQWEADTGNGEISLFSAYDHTGEITIATSATDLTYGQQIHRDALYSHTAGSSGITVQQPGTYFVSVDVSLKVTSGTTASFVDVYLAKNGIEIQGTRGTVATSNTSARGSISINRMVSLAASDVLKVQGVLNTSGNTVKTIADSSRISITRLRETLANRGVNGSSVGLLLVLTYS